MNCTNLIYLIAGMILTANVAIAGDYQDNGNGTITDVKSGLIWQKGEQGKMRWEVARRHCAMMKLAGFNDWRMPSKKELLTLVERNMFNPCIDRRYFSDAKPVEYWTISQGTLSAGSAAWLVNFGYGDTRFFNKSNEYAVRCVR
jgi:hypothetical protein